MLSRFRLQYDRNGDLIFISHLDLMRFWERAFRRAKIPLAYSEGFTPHPRISLAAPLPLGVSSEAELLDAFLQSFIPPPVLLESLKKQMPVGIQLRRLWRLPVESPSLQSQTLFAEYRVNLDSDRSEQEIRESIRSFLDKENIPWQHSRDTGPRNYNIRSLVQEVHLLSVNEGQCTLGMKLQSDASGSGRPEQVSLALGFDKYPVSIHRTALILKGHG